MSKYAILNFEDKIGETNKGAADSTIKALKHRYESTKQIKGVKALFQGKHSVNEYRCVTDTPAIQFTTDATTLQGIKAACAAAEKIYLIMHGDPRTTDTCYTNAVGAVGVIALATSLQLATFLSALLPKKDGLRIALVMCYGARCKDYRSANVNHQGAIDIGNLKTSFAYRLLYELVQQGYSPALSAVTGKIQHDHTSGRALVEKEELIDINMELAESMRAYTQAAKLHDGGGAEYKKAGPGKVQFDQISTLQDQRKVLRAQVGGGDESNKYGKLVYKYKGTTLAVANKYGGGTGAGSVGPGTIIYSGPLVTPGAA
jgi:hypothetical protein